MQNNYKKTSVHKIYRIKSPVKLCIFLTVIMLLLFTLIASLWFKSKAMEPVVLMELEIATGDTLWSIAKRYLPPDRDIRDYILEIKAINNLEEANLIAGQYITIPLYSEHNT